MKIQKIRYHQFIGEDKGFLLMLNFISKSFEPWSMVFLIENREFFDFLARPGIQGLWDEVQRIRKKPLSFSIKRISEILDSKVTGIPVAAYISACFVHSQIRLQYSVWELTYYTVYTRHEFAPIRVSPRKI